MLKEIIAALATIFIVSSYIPQIIKGYRTKKMDDVSMGFLVIVSIGILFWAVYGIINKDVVFIIANIFNVSFAVILIIMKLHYKRSKK